MITKRTLVGRAVWASSLAAALLLAGCAARTEPPAVGGAPVAAAKAPAAPPAGTVLEYKMPEGRILSYQSIGEGVESTEAMGQSMESHTSSRDAFSLKAKGRKEGNLLMGVTIEDMAITITGPQGDMSPDMTSVKGRTFDMVVSPLGAEVDVAGAEAITYEMATGRRNISTGFKLFFPDLPGRSLKVGESWPSGGGTDEKAGGLNLRFDFQNANTLEGFETVDGMVCARVRSQVTATISGSGNQQGMDMAFSGTGQGTDLWYFAVKEGIYVKSTAQMTMDMSITISSIGQTIPVKQTRKGEVKLFVVK
ncbi:MAG: hypothetical protein HGA24_04620 [Candidatus Aminicenantes bacterium]|nr:hypothetical protein [Candidatus Aminicenantes bacterium]